MASLLDIYRQNDPEKARLEAEKKALEAKRSSAISGIQTIGSGGLSLGDIDKWLTDNPDAQYFRIGNGGSVNDSRLRGGNPFGMMNMGGAGLGQGQVDGKGPTDSRGGGWYDTDAAIVSQDTDENQKSIFRYATVQPRAADAKGKKGEQATIGINWTPEEFYKQNGFDWSADDGMIVSRNEYGQLKERIKASDTSGFLNAPQKYPERKVTSPNIVDDLVSTEQKKKPVTKATILTGAPEGLGGGGTILGG